MDKKKSVMIGDRLDTDIQFGNDGGIDTLVLFPALPFPIHTLVLFSHSSVDSSKVSILIGTLVPSSVSSHRHSSVTFKTIC